MSILPKARTENLVEQNFDKEVLIYDLLTNKAYNLNETSALIYKACDGKRRFGELKRRHKFTDDLIYLALDELKRNDLLTDDAAYRSPFAGINRREVIKKVGLTSVAALPIIAGVIAPKAASAASGAVACVFGAPCSCSVPNNSGGNAFCGDDLNGASTNCGSGGASGCDCNIPDGSNTGGTCVVFL